MTDAAPQREAFRRALRAYGRNATSFQLLDRDFHIWTDDAFDGIDPPAAVAYVDTGSAWVAGGQPLAPDHLVHAVAERFLDKRTRRVGALRFSRRKADWRARRASPACCWANNRCGTRASGARRWRVHVHCARSYDAHGARVSR